METSINKLGLTARPIAAKAVTFRERPQQTHTPIAPPKYSAPGQTLKDLYGAIPFVDFYGHGDIAQKWAPTMTERYVISIDTLIETGAAVNRNVMMLGDDFHVYNGRYYEKHDEPELDRFLTDAVHRMSWSPIEAKFYAKTEKLVKQLHKMTRRERRELLKDKVLLNFQNGTLEIDKAGARFREHRAEDYLTSCVSYEYDSQATCPKFDEFLNEMLPDKPSQDLLFDFLAVVLLPSIKCEKVLFLHGDGRNGKSVIFDVVKALFGEGNVSNYTIDELTNDKGYCLIGIMDKLLNYGPDVELSMNTSALKTLASGEEKMVREIYQKQRTMKVYARQMYNTNGVLEKGFEVTDAIKSRMEFIPFTVKVSEERKDLELAQKLIAECAGIMNRVLRHVDSVLANSGKLTYCEASQTQMDDMFSYIDTIDDFLIDNCYEPSGGIPDMLLKVLYGTYVEYCSQFHLPNSGYNKFSAGLRKRGFKVEKINSKGRYVNACHSVAGLVL